MKVFFLSLAVLTFSLNSFADFVPGRVRVSATAAMKVVSASGVFEGVKSAVANQLVTDGVKRETYTITLSENKNTISFVAAVYQPSSCGDTVIAVSHDITPVPVQSRMRLKDMSRALCRIAVEDGWVMTIEQRDPSNNQVSVLVLKGNPEYFQLSM
jgi:hypothetical protein